MSLLLDTIFYSKKRKEILFLLHKYNNLNINQLKYILKETSVSILPQLKKLIDLKLVYILNGNYRLTPLGILIFNKIGPLLEKMDLLDNNINYWSNCDFGSIPPLFKNRINEINQFDVININIKNSEFNNLSNILIKIFETQEKLSILTDNDHYKYYKICNKRKLKNMETKIITRDNIANKIYREILMNENKQPNYIKIYKIPESLDLFDVILTSDMVMFSFKKIKENFNILTYIISSSPSSLFYGKDIIEFFEKQSVRMI